MLKKLLTVATISSVAFTSSSLLAAPKLTSEDDKQSYAAGFMQGETLQKLKAELGINLNSQIFQDGLKDGLNNKKPAISDDEIKKSLVSLQQQIFAKQKNMMDKKFTENKSKSVAFMEKVKNEKNVKSLGDGVFYKVNKSGATSGSTPKLSDSVEVNYKGTTVDGKEFDSGKNITLALNNVIKGWQEALVKMKPGDNWTVYVPSKAAYGERGAPNIMPNSALIFDIELLKVVSPAKSN